MKRFLHTIALAPTFFIFITLLSRSVYVCQSDILFWSSIVLSIIIAWLASKKFMAMKGLVLKIAFVVVTLFIVSAILLASLNCTRCAGPLASGEHALLNARAQAEIVYSNNGHSYQTVCDDEQILLLLQAAKESVRQDEFSCYGPVMHFLMPEQVTSSYVICNAKEDSYTMEMYSSRTASYFCVDSSDNIGSNQYSMGENTVCPKE